MLEIACHSPRAATHSAQAALAAKPRRNSTSNGGTASVTSFMKLSPMTKTAVAATMAAMPPSSEVLFMRPDGFPSSFIAARSERSLKLRRTTRSYLGAVVLPLRADAVIESPSCAARWPGNAAEPPPSRSAHQGLSRRCSSAAETGQPTCGPVSGGCHLGCGFRQSGPMRLDEHRLVRDGGQVDVALRRTPLGCDLLGFELLGNASRRADGEHARGHFKPLAYIAHGGHPGIGADGRAIHHDAVDADEGVHAH